MKCSVCGSKVISIITDLPFKVSGLTIVIVKGLPVFQCDNCCEFLLADPVIDQVDAMLSKVAPTAELEVIGYAA